MCAAQRERARGQQCGQPTFFPPFLSSANMEDIFFIKFFSYIGKYLSRKEVSWLTFSPLLSIAARPSILKSHNQRLHRRRRSIRVRWFVCGNKGGCGIFNRMSPPRHHTIPIFSRPARTFFPQSSSLFSFVFLKSLVAELCHLQ